MKEYKLKINGNDYDVTINDIEDSTAKVEVNGMPFTVEFDKPLKKAAPAPAVKKAAAPKAAAASSGNGTVVTSPLPGVILEVSCKEGDTVKVGQKLMVLEAMKMENIIEATANGTVTSIKANKGDSVLEGADLVVIG